MSENGSYKKRFPKTISFHVTEEEYAYFEKIRDARRKKSPGMNFRELFLEWKQVLNHYKHYLLEEKDNERTD